MTDAMAWLPTDETQLDAAAVAYASHGFRVIPVWGVRPDGSCQCGKSGCSAPGKHPIGATWQKRASSEPDAVRDARRGKSQASIGLVMGGERRLVAVDVDGEPGRRSLADIEANVRPWPATLTSASGRKDGGEHRIFSVPAHLDIKRLGNRARSKWPGIDTRTDNGQIVAAPSMHASGTRYRWTVRAPIAEMPEWLFEALAIEIPTGASSTRSLPLSTPSPTPTSSTPDRDNVRSYVGKVVENAAREVASCSQGGRNALLWTKACTVFEYHVGEGLDHAEAWSALESAGRACGLPPAEVRAVLSKAWKHAQTSTPRKVPPPSAPSSPAQTPTSATGYEWTDDAPAAPAESRAWESLLTPTADGAPKNTFGNICKILRHAPIFAGRLAYNRMRVAPYLDGRPLRDADVGKIREDIEARWGLAPSRDAVVQAIGLVAEERSFHPVQDYLRGLKWDGERRISRVGSDVLGIPGDALADRMIRAWFISAVARALRPGCKVDTTLVLVGFQGFRKSTFFAELGGEWFSDSYADVRSKDGVLHVHAAWIYEWAEIERVTTKRDAADVKAFLTIARDDVRPPYGQGVVSQQRSGVIVGSTNKEHFLADETGSRRFWPLRVTRRVDVALLRSWRDQLWAEAVAGFDAGEEWWLSDEEDARREEAAIEHTEDDAWTEAIAAYVSHPVRLQGGVTTADVLVGAINLELGRATRADETRAGKVLRQIGWEAHQARRGNARVRVYRMAQPKAPVVTHVVTPKSPMVPSTAQLTQPTQPSGVGEEKGRERGRENGSQEKVETGCDGCDVVTGDDVGHAFSDFVGRP